MYNKVLSLQKYKTGQYGCAHTVSTSRKSGRPYTTLCTASFQSTEDRRDENMFFLTSATSILFAFFFFYTKSMHYYHNFKIQEETKDQTESKGFKNFSIFFGTLLGPIVCFKNKNMIDSVFSILLYAFAFYFWDLIAEYYLLNLKFHKYHLLACIKNL